MAVNKVNLLWKSFKGIRKLNSINSDTTLGADIALNVSLSKEKSGQERSIKSSGWFNDYMTLEENVIALFPANMSGYEQPNQLVAFTKTGTNINAWIVEDDSGKIIPVKIAEFPIAEDVYDACMTQFGDRLVLVCAFGNNTLGFIAYSATNLTGWTAINTNWYYRVENIVESTTNKPVNSIKSIIPYRSRLAINGITEYDEQGSETIYGVWFSEAGNPISFTAEYASQATETSAFFVETGEYINKIVEYHGLTCFGRNRSFNIYGTSQGDIRTDPLTAKGVFGNGAFVLNGQCAYVDSYSRNIFTLRNNIDTTIGFDTAIGDDIQDFLSEVERVSINSIGRRVRMMKESGESLVYDVDIGEWTVETFKKGSRCITFLNKEIMCDGTEVLKQVTLDRQATSFQVPTTEGYYSYYKTNLIWLDSQSSIKSHIYPFAVILEPRTNNDFFIKFTTDRGQSTLGRITRSGFINIATYSENDEPSSDGTVFVDDDDDLSGRVFFSFANTELLVTVDRPPFWRYLQIEIYTTSPMMEFNIAGIEAKNTFITDEQLDY